jgi:hypothetical protein
MAGTLNTGRKHTSRGLYRAKLWRCFVIVAVVVNREPSSSTPMTAPGAQCSEVR